VYYFSNFTVKPANKQYVTVRNDYQINFDGRWVRAQHTQARAQLGQQLFTCLHGVSSKLDAPVRWSCMLVQFAKLVMLLGLLVLFACRTAYHVS
jgi:hypothetical protein